MATQVNDLKTRVGRRWHWGGSLGRAPASAHKLAEETKTIRGTVTFVIALTVTLLVGCKPDATADLQVEPLDHACAILERVNTADIVSFVSVRIAPTEERNLDEVRISKCDHYAKDMSRHFRLVVRQDFSNRRLESGSEQLSRLRSNLERIPHDGTYWRAFDHLGEAAAWNGTANQLMVYWDQGHTMVAVSVYGTGDELQKTLDLAEATMSELSYTQ